MKVTDRGRSVHKLRIDREAIEKLPPEKQDEALRTLEAYESAIRANPLLAYQPHAKQISFHEGREQIKAFLGGNRSGKTTAGILDDLIQAVDEDCLPPHLLGYKKFQPPFHCRIIVPGEDIMYAVVFQKLREWCPCSQLVGDSFGKAYEKSRGILRFKNGSFFDFLSYGQELDKFGGTAKHRIHYDEEPPQAIRNEGKVRLEYDGADELFTMTPLFGMSWMFDEIWEPWQKGKLENGKVVLVDLDENPYISKEQKRRMLQGYSKEELEARKSGRFVHFAGMIYDEFRRNEHVIPHLETLPPNVNVYLGIDPGMRHMAGVVWTYINTEHMMVVFDELALQGHNIKQVCDEIKSVNLKWGQRTGNVIAPLVPVWTAIDPAARNMQHGTGRSDQWEYAKEGISTVLGQNSKTAGISAVKARLQAHKLLVCANCTTLIDEFRRYRWAPAKKVLDDPKEEPVKSKDHLLDALRYVISTMPYANPESEQERPLAPLEKAAREEIKGSNYNRRKIPRTPMGGIYA